MILIADLDGTLSPAHQTSPPAIQLALRESSFSQKILVTGGGWEKTRCQINPRLFDKIVCESGGALYVEERLVSRDTHTEWPEEMLSLLSERVGRTGGSLEIRYSMINASFSGRDKPENRPMFAEMDARESVRAAVALEVESLWPQYTARLGGEVNIDIAPVGWDKTRALAHAPESERIVFIGDRVAAGGNDREIALEVLERGGTVHAVSSVEETLDHIRRYR